MSATSLLVNPALFSGLDVPPEQIAAEYLDMAEKYPVDFHMVRAHLYKFLNNL